MADSTVDWTKEWSYRTGSSGGSTGLTEEQLNNITSTVKESVLNELTLEATGDNDVTLSLSKGDTN